MKGITEIIRVAVSDFRGSFRALLVADVLFKIVGALLLAPVVGLALAAFVALSGDEIVADEHILSFFLSPLGLVALIVASAASLAIVALEQAWLMAVATGSRGPLNPVPVLRLTVRIVVRVMVLALPFLAAAGLVAVVLLGEHDINYYLSERRRSGWRRPW